MLISTVTGKESFATGTAQCHVFVVPTSRALSKETHLGVLVGANNPQIPVTKHSLQRHPARSGSAVDHGFWMQGTYDVPEGTILKIFGHKTTSAATAQASRSQVMMGAKLIQLRANAALRRISFITTRNPSATFQNVHIEGRFDILTLKEAFGLGAQIDVTRVKQYQVAYMDRIFTESVIDRELSSRPTIVTSEVTSDDGSRKRIQTAVSTRVVDLD